MKRNGDLIGRRVWELLIPCILTTIALQTGNVVDGILVGNILGETALATIQLLMPIITMAQLPSQLFGIGTVIVIGSLMGNREVEKANKTMTTIVLLNALVSIVIVAVLVVGFDPILNVIAGSGDGRFRQDAAGYLAWFLPSIPMINMLYPVLLLMNIDGNPKLASLYMVLSNVINLVFDYLLLKYTKIGTGGAALSSFLGYFLCLWIFILYAKSKNRLLKLDIHLGTIKEITERIKEAAITGQPTFIAMLLVMIRNLGLNMIIMSSAGSEAMIAFTLCCNIVMITTLIVGGIEQMIPNIGGILYGEKDYFGIRHVMKMVFKISVCFLVVWMVIVSVFPSNIAALYGISEGASRALSVTCLRIFVLSLPFMVWNKFAMSLYQITDKLKLATSITMMQNLFLVLPLAVILAKIMGIYGVIMALVLSEMLTVLLTYFIRRKRYPEYNNFMLIPDKTEYPNMEASIRNNLKAVMEVSDLLTFFGEMHQLTETEACYLGLVVEELVVNVTEFEENKDRNIKMDISVTILEDQILIRIRDDGVILNPWEAKDDQKKMDAAEPIESIDPIEPIEPIELVRRISSETSYMRMLNMNNTIVTLNKAQAKEDSHGAASSK